VCARLCALLTAARRAAPQAQARLAAAWAAAARAPLALPPPTFSTRTEREAAALRPLLPTARADLERFAGAAVSPRLAKELCNVMLLWARSCAVPPPALSPAQEKSAKFIEHCLRCRARPAAPCAFDGCGGGTGTEAKPVFRDLIEVGVAAGCAAPSSPRAGNGAAAAVAAVRVHRPRPPLVPPFPPLPPPLPSR
jgi:hypothetical protein